MNEIVVMITSAKDWLSKSIEQCQNHLAALPLVIVYALLGVMFPTETHIVAFFVLVFTIFLDTFAKIFSLAKKHRKFIGVITSCKLWAGISGKLFVLIILSILLGLANYISIISLIGSGLVTAIYGILFLREAYSVLENLFDAGFEQVDVFLKIIKAREKKVLRENEVNEE